MSPSPFLAFCLAQGRAQRIAGLTPGQRELADDQSIGTSLKYRVALLMIVSTSATMDWSMD
jgi:hypothetical protein